MSEEPRQRDVCDKLRALRVDSPDGEFQASLRRRLLAVGPPAPATAWERLRAALGDRRALRWPALGAAAGLAVFLALTALTALHPRSAGPHPSAAVTFLPATKVAVVRVNLTADVPVDSAHVRVTLPPELSFWADGRALPQRAFEWIQPLRRGDNEIPIAVRGQRPGRYRIAVSALVGDERIDDEIVLEVTDG